MIVKSENMFVCLFFPIRRQLQEVRNFVYPAHCWAWIEEELATLLSERMNERKWSQVCICICITLYKNVPSHAGRVRGDFYFVLQKRVYFENIIYM